MTEAEWLACADPDELLHQLQGRAGERKLRLFACACCQRVGLLPADRAARRAVEAAERYADGLASAGELAAAARAAGRAAPLPEQTLYRAAKRALKITQKQVRRADTREEYWRSLLRSLAARRWCREAARAVREAGAKHAAERETARAAQLAAGEPFGILPALGASRAAARARWHAGEVPDWAEERAAQCHILRDLCGNPLRPAAVQAAWVTARVVHTALTIYEGRTLGHLEVLADALEEAGCTNREVLAHCRQGGEHWRGCWAVDLVLGRQ